MPETLGSLRVQISLILEQDESSDIIVNSESGLANYVIKGKNKIITITNIAFSKDVEK